MADMLETYFRQEIAAHEPADERESAARRRILAELDRLPRPFDETADLVHVTGSAVVVSQRGVLLHRHKRLGRWLQPGGHVDAGEAPWDTAVRETREETGLRASHADDRPRVFHVDVHEGGRGHTHLDVRYLLITDGEDPCPRPGESPDVHWFELRTARDLADAGLIAALHRRELDDLLSALNYVE